MTRTGGQVSLTVLSDLLSANRSSVSNGMFAKTKNCNCTYELLSWFFLNVIFWFLEIDSRPRFIVKIFHRDQLLFAIWWSKEFKMPYGISVIIFGQHKMTENIEYIILIQFHQRNLFCSDCKMFWKLAWCCKSLMTLQCHPGRTHHLICAACKRFCSFQLKYFALIGF